MLSVKRSIIIILILINYQAAANIYYVAPNGNNSNPGTITQPWLTWSYAFAHAYAGDTVYFRGGTYTSTTSPGGESGFNSGTANRRIYFLNYPGEIPILDCSNKIAAPYNRGITIWGPDYLYFKGLTVRNVYQTQINCNASGWALENNSGITFENCTTHHVAGEANIVSNYHDTIRYINCDAYNVCDSLRSAVYPTPGSPGQNGGAFHQSNTSDPNAVLTYYGCRAWNFSDNGFAGQSVGYVEYDNCWAFNGRGELSGDGCGFKYASTYGSDNTLNLGRTIKNCISAYNASYGFSPNNSGDTPTAVHFYNNTAYHNGYYGEAFGHGLVINAHDTLNDGLKGNAFILPNEKCYNNICYDNEKGEVYVSGSLPNLYHHEYNSWDTPPGVTLTDDDFVSLDWTEMLRPRKSDGSLPEINFLKLAPGSDLIDKGTYVGIPYSGGAPDLGWYETSLTTIPTPPSYVSSVIENASPSRIEMTYNLTLANIVPATSAFSVRVNSNARTVSSAAISGNKVLLTIASPVVFGDVVTVAYTKPATNPLQTATGGQAASISAQNVINNVVAVIPVYSSSVIENASPSRIEMTYNLTLANIVPATSAFSVRVNSNARTVSSVAISGNKVLLTIASPVVFGDVVTVAYTKPATNPLQTATGGQAASISAQNVINNVVAVIPVYSSSVIENASPSRIEMTYNLTLANIVPATSAFSVRVNSNARTVSSVAISGNKVLLTIASPVVFGDVVTVAYTKPATNPLQTATGGQAASISAQNVINSVVASNQPPLITISSPNKSELFNAPAIITIDALASDPDGTITKVEFYQSSVKLGELTSAPYIFVWKEVPEGIYSITAVAVDNFNLRTVSSPVSVVVEKSSVAVNQYPIVRVTLPNGKKPKKHDSVIIIAEASDPDGIISKVEIKSSETTLAELTEAPYILTLENIDTGTYNIKAIATDNMGATTISSEIEFRVENYIDPNMGIISLYPNPNQGNFIINLISELPEGSVITIINFEGKAVHSEVWENYETIQEINLSNAPPGNYILMITNKDNILTTKKFIKR